MSKTLSAKYYQENKDYKIKLVKDITVFLKKKNKKMHNMVVNVTAMFRILKAKACCV